MQTRLVAVGGSSMMVVVPAKLVRSWGLRERDHIDFEIVGDHIEGKITRLRSACTAAGPRSSESEMAFFVELRRKTLRTFLFFGLPIIALAVLAVVTVALRDLTR